MGQVLLVDDEDALRRALSRKLNANGHVVQDVGTAKRAIELLETATNIDVVVSDIRMPEMDGLQLLRLVRERDPDMPVILLTGSPDVSTAVKAVGYGAFEYLTKPDDLPRLSECVTRAISQRRTSTTQRRLLEAARGERPRRTTSVATGSLVAGKYRVGRELGLGGMGIVYEARREDLGDMRVALKVLHTRHADRPDQLRRFRQEAELVARIDCTSIVKLIDFVSDDEGPHCIVMELLDGVTLASAIADELEFSQQRVALIGAQVLAALGAAHAVSVLHRDLKPENVFLTSIAGMNDVVKLLDFGIAKLVSAEVDTKLTETGVILGTPAYMAPEYARGEPASPRGDLYALGCVMYEALTRKQPFAAANYNALLFAIQQREPVPLRVMRPDVSADFAAVIERAMSKEPSARFASAAEMADALKPWAAFEPPRETPRARIEALAPTEESLDCSLAKKP